MFERGGALLDLGGHFGALQGVDDRVGEVGCGVVGDAASDQLVLDDVTPVRGGASGHAQFAIR